MVNLGTESKLEETHFDMSEIRYATPEIAASWKLHYERKALESQQKRKRPLPTWFEIWACINRHPGISWQQFTEKFTRHSLNDSLLFLIKERGVIQRVEGEKVKGAGRGPKPTRYFPLQSLGVTYSGYYIGKTPVFGVLCTRRTDTDPRPVLVKDKLSQEKFPFKRVTKTKTQITRYIQRYQGEKEWIEERCKKDKSFAAATQLAKRKRKDIFFETRAKKES